MEDFEAPQQAPKTTQKRSFFSKPAVTVQDVSGDENDGADFFRQSSTCFSSIMHEQEKKKQRKLVRKMKEKAAQNEPDEDIDAPLESRKRRKKSVEDGAEMDLVELAHSPLRQMRSRSNSPTTRNAMKMHRDTAAAPLKPAVDEVIELADSTPEPSLDGDDDDLYAAPMPRKSPSNVKSNPIEIIEVPSETQTSDLEDDDEDADIVAKLLARKHQRELDALKRSPSRKGDMQAIRSQQWSTQPDPPVSVLISSTIKDMKPLIVRIYLSKKIAELLKTWCNYNNLNSQQSAEMFLAWRTMKQWPTTTLRGMLESAVDFDVSDDGAIISKPGCKGEGLSDDFNKIHLIATTEDGLAQLKSRHQRAVHRSNQDVDSDGELNGGLSDVPAEGSSAKMDDNIPITLKQGKEYGELKIKVKRDTSIARIITAFRKARKIPDGKVVTLRFDGDELDPDNVMADTEIEDRDTIEVYVR